MLIAVMVGIDRTRGGSGGAVVPLATRVILDAGAARGVVRCRVALAPRARL